jgi:hypothetical protein
MCTCTNTAANDISEKKLSRIQLILQELTQLWNQTGLSFPAAQSKTKALGILTPEISGRIGDIVITGRVKYTLLGAW